MSAATSIAGHIGTSSLFILIYIHNENLLDFSKLHPVIKNAKMANLKGWKFYTYSCTRVITELAICLVVLSCWHSISFLHGDISYEFYFSPADRAKCNGLRSHEESLKEDCRQLRKELAQFRQKQWYANVASNAPLVNKRQHRGPPRNNQGNTDRSTKQCITNNCVRVEPPLTRYNGISLVVSNRKAIGKRNVLREEIKLKTVRGPDQMQRRISQYMVPNPRPNQTGGKFNFKPTSMDLNSNKTTRELKPASDYKQPLSLHSEKNVGKMGYEVKVINMCYPKRANLTWMIYRGMFVWVRCSFHFESVPIHVQTLAISR